MKFEILAQIFGFGALISSIIIYSRKNRSSLLIFKATQDIFWGIHYLLLACYTAAVTSAIGVSRSFVFYHSDKKWAKSKLWILAYLVFYAVSAVFTWQNVYSLLPAVASCTSTVAFYLKKPEQTKALQIFASLIILCYTILQSHSITVYLGVALTVTTAGISLLNHCKNKTKQAG